MILEKNFMAAEMHFGSHETNATMPPPPGSAG